VSLPRSLGLRIVQLRKDREWTQERLAAEADLSPRYIQQLEHGLRWPKPETLEKLANAFEIEPEDIFRKI